MAGRSTSTRPTDASHALMFAGGFELAVEDETGLDPDFLALL